MSGIIGTIKVPVSADIAQAQQSLQGLRKFAENLDLGSGLGRSIDKALSGVEKSLSKFEGKEFLRFGSESQLTKYQTELQDIYSALNNIATMAQGVTLNDLNTSKFTGELSELQSKLESITSQLATAMNKADFSKTIKESEAMKAAFAAIGEDLSKLDISKVSKTLETGISGLNKELETARKNLAAVTAEQEKLNAASLPSGPVNQKKRMTAIKGASSEYLAGLSISSKDFTQLSNSFNALFNNEIFKDLDANIKTKLQAALENGLNGIDASDLSATKMRSIFQAIKGEMQTILTESGTATPTGYFKTLQTNFEVDAANLRQSVANKTTELRTFLTDQLAHIMPDESTNGIKTLVDNFIQTLNSDGWDKAKTLLNNRFNEMKQTALDAAADHEKALKEVGERYKAAQELFTNVETRLNTAKGGKTEYSRIETELTERIGRLEAELATVKQQLDEKVQEPLSKLKTDAGSQIAPNQNAINQLTAQVAQYSVELDHAKQKEKLLGQVGGLVQRWVGVYAAVRYVTKAFQDMKKAVAEVDRTITNISIVTGMSQDKLWGQMDQYITKAQKFAASISGVYQVSQLYYQQGLETAQVSALTDETLKLATVSGLGYSEATNYMTNAVRSFKMEMADAAVVTDTYAALAASAATSVSEIAVAMSKTASSAQAVGMSLQDTAAMITVMTEATREAPENIGSALKSIISRYGELKENPAALTDSEGQEMSFNKVDKALSSVGISMKDANGQFRSFTDVIVELSGKWDTLDTNTQRYIATVMAGNRQQSRFLALVSSGERLGELMSVAEDSEGSGTEQYLAYLDSIEAKQTKLANSWKALYMSEGIQNAYKGVLDIFTYITNSLNSIENNALIKGTGWISVASTVVTTFIAASKLIMTTFENMIVSIKSKIENITALKNGAQANLGQAQNGDKAATEAALIPAARKEILGAENKTINAQLHINEDGSVSVAKEDLAKLSEPIKAALGVNDDNLRVTQAKIDQLKAQGININVQATTEQAQAAINQLPTEIQSSFHANDDGSVSIIGNEIAGIPELKNVHLSVNADGQLQVAKQDLASIPPEIRTKLGIQEDGTLKQAKAETDALGNKVVKPKMDGSELKAGADAADAEMEEVGKKLAEGVAGGASQAAATLEKLKGTLNKATNVRRDNVETTITPTSPSAGFTEGAAGETEALAEDYDVEVKIDTEEAQTNLRMLAAELQELQNKLAELKEENKGDEKIVDDDALKDAEKAVSELKDHLEETATELEEGLDGSEAASAFTSLAVEAEGASGKVNKVSTSLNANANAAGKAANKNKAAAASEKEVNNNAKEAAGGVKGLKTQMDLAAEGAHRFRDALASLRTAFKTLWKQIKTQSLSIFTMLINLINLIPNTTLKAVAGIMLIGTAVVLVARNINAALSQGPMIIITAIAAALTFIYNIIGEISNAAENRLKELQEAADEAQSKATEQRSKSKTLNKEAKNLQKLAEAQYDSEEALRAFHEEQNKIYEDLGDEIPGLLAGYDEWGNALINLGAYYEYVNEQAQKTAQTAAAAADAQIALIEEQKKQDKNRGQNSANYKKQKQAQIRTAMNAAAEARIARYNDTSSGYYNQVNAEFYQEHAEAQNMIASIMTKEFKRSGYSKIEDWQASAGYESAMNRVEASVISFYNGMGDNLEELEELNKNKGKLTREQYSQQLRELGVTGEAYTYYMEQFGDYVANFNDMIDASLAGVDTNSAAYRLGDFIKTETASFINKLSNEEKLSFKKYYSKVIKLVNNGTITEEQGRQILDNYAKLWEATTHIADDEQRERAQAALRNYDPNSRASARETQEILTNGDIEWAEEDANVVEESATNLVELSIANTVAAINTFFSIVGETFDNLEKSISSWTKGATWETAEKLVNSEKTNIHFRDFSFRGGRFYLNDIGLVGTEEISKIKTTQQTLQEDWQFLSTYLQSFSHISSIISQVSNAPFSSVAGLPINDTSIYGRLRDALSITETMSGYFDNEEDLWRAYSRSNNKGRALQELFGLESEATEQLINEVDTYRQQWIKLPDTIKQSYGSFSQYLISEIQGLEEELNVAAEYLDYIVASNYINQGQIRQWLASDDILENSFGTVSERVIQAITSLDFTALAGMIGQEDGLTQDQYNYIMTYSDLLYETYHNAQKEVYTSAINSLANGQQAVSVTATNQEFLRRWGTDIQGNRLNLKYQSGAEMLADGVAAAYLDLTALTNEELNQLEEEILADTTMDEATKRSLLSSLHTNRYTNTFYNRVTSLVSNFENVTYDTLDKLANAMDITTNELIQQLGGLDNILDPLTGNFKISADQVRALISRNMTNIGKEYNALWGKIDDAEYKTSQDSQLNTIISNYNKLSGEMIANLATQLGKSYNELSALLKDNGNGTYSLTLPQLTNYLHNIYGNELPEAIANSLHSAYDTVIKSISQASGLQTKGYTTFTDMKNFVDNLNELVDSLNVGIFDVFEWDKESGTYVLSEAGIQAQMQAFAVQMQTMSDEQRRVAEQTIENNRVQLAKAIDIKGYLSSRSDESWKKVERAIQNYNKYIEAVQTAGLQRLSAHGTSWYNPGDGQVYTTIDYDNGWRNQIIDATSLRSVLDFGGLNAIKAIQDFAKITGEENDYATLKTAYQGKLNEVVKTANELANIQVGSVLDEATGILLETSSGITFDPQLKAQGLYVVQSIEDIGEAYKTYLNQLKATAGRTVKEVNAAAAKVMEYTFGNTNEQFAIDALGSATSMTYEAFGEFLANYNIELTEQLMQSLNNAGIIDFIGGNKIAITDFDYLARNVLHLEVGSPAYVSALKTYNDSLITFNSQVETNILDEFSKLNGAIGGSQLNFTQIANSLYNTLSKITHTESFNPEQGVIVTRLASQWDVLQRQLISAGAIFENGILTLADNADILSITSTIASYMQQYGNLTQAQLAQLADTVNEVLQSYVDMIRNGIAGTLSNVDMQKLVAWGDSQGINVQYTRTTEGLKLTTKSATELYTALKAVDSLAAKSVLQDLLDSHKAEIGLNTITGLMGKIAQIRKELEAARSAHNETAIKQLNEELKLYQDIARARMNDANSYSFMNNNLPNGLQGPVNYWESWYTGIQTILESGESGYMKPQDFYNLISEFGNMAMIAGQDLEIAGQKFDAAGNNTSQLILDGFNAIKMVEGEGPRVDLSSIGLSFASSAESLDAGLEDGIHAMAESQVSIWEGIVGLLEVVVQMEELGNIDADNDMIIELPEIGIEDPTNRGHLTSYLENYDRWRRETLAMITEGSDTYNATMAEAANTLVINGRTLAETLNKDAAQIDETDTLLLSFWNRLAAHDWNVEELATEDWTAIEEAAEAAGEPIRVEWQGIEYFVGNNTHFAVDWNRQDLTGLTEEQRKQISTEALRYLNNPNSASAIEYISYLTLSGDMEIINGRHVLTIDGEQYYFDDAGNAEDALAEAALRSLNLRNLGFSRNDIKRDGDTFYATKDLGAGDNKITYRVTVDQNGEFVFKTTDGVTIVDEDGNPVETQAQAEERMMEEAFRNWKNGRHFHGSARDWQYNTEFLEYIGISARQELNLNNIQHAMGSDSIPYNYLNELAQRWLRGEIKSDELILEAQATLRPYGFDVEGMTTEDFFAALGMENVIKNVEVHLNPEGAQFVRVLGEDNTIERELRIELTGDGANLMRIFLGDYDKATIQALYEKDPTNDFWVTHGFKNADGSWNSEWVKQGTTADENGHILNIPDWDKIVAAVQEHGITNETDPWAYIARFNFWGGNGPLYGGNTTPEGTNVTVTLDQTGFGGEVGNFGKHVTKFSNAARDWAAAATRTENMAAIRAAYGLNDEAQWRAWVAANFEGRSPEAVTSAEYARAAAQVYQHAIEIGFINANPNTSLDAVEWDEESQSYKLKEGYSGRINSYTAIPLTDMAKYYTVTIDDENQVTTSGNVVDYIRYGLATNETEAWREIENDIMLFGGTAAYDEAYALIDTYKEVVEGAPDNDKDVWEAIRAWQRSNEVSSNPTDLTTWLTDYQQTTNRINRALTSDEQSRIRETAGPNREDQRLALENELHAREAYFNAHGITTDEMYAEGQDIAENYSVMVATDTAIQNLGLKYITDDSGRIIGIADQNNERIDSLEYDLATESGRQNYIKAAEARADFYRGTHETLVSADLDDSTYEQDLEIAQLLRDEATFASLELTDDEMAQLRTWHTSGLLRDRETANAALANYRRVHNPNDSLFGQRRFLPENFNWDDLTPDELNNLIGWMELWNNAGWAPPKESRGSYTDIAAYMNATGRQTAYENRAALIAFANADENDNFDFADIQLINDWETNNHIQHMLSSENIDFTAWWTNIERLVAAGIDIKQAINDTYNEDAEIAAQQAEQYADFVEREYGLHNGQGQFIGFDEDSKPDHETAFAAWQAYQEEYDSLMASLQEDNFIIQNAGDSPLTLEELRKIDAIRKNRSDITQIDRNMIDDWYQYFSDGSENKITDQEIAAIRLWRNNPNYSIMPEDVAAFRTLGSTNPTYQAYLLNRTGTDINPEQVITSETYDRLTERGYNLLNLADWTALEAIQQAAGVASFNDIPEWLLDNLELVENWWGEGYDTELIKYLMSQNPTERTRMLHFMSGDSGWNLGELENTQDWFNTPQFAVKAYENGTFTWVDPDLALSESIRVLEAYGAQVDRQGLRRSDLRNSGLEFMYDLYSQSYDIQGNQELVNAAIESGNIWEYIEDITRYTNMTRDQVITMLSPYISNENWSEFQRHEHLRDDQTYTRDNPSPTLPEDYLTSLSGHIDDLNKHINTFIASASPLENMKMQGDVVLDVTTRGEGQVSAGGTQHFTFGSNSAAAGNLALAGGTSTLMGELGPELVVSGGKYFVAGQNGAEFVNLDKDAIVFNHLQTKRLLNTGHSGHGKPITNEREATSFAKGNASGPAMASASAALNSARQILAAWKSLANLGLSDLAQKAGGGGGGGGDKSSAAYLADLELWYNLLREVDRLEKSITYQESLRSKLEKDRIIDGKAYYESQKESIKLLEEEIEKKHELVILQKQYYDARRADLEKTPFGQFISYDEHGHLQFTDDYSKLVDMNATNADGSTKYTAEEQYNLLKSWGFEDYLKYDTSGKEIDMSKEEEGYTNAVKAFWDKFEGWKEELDDLYDGFTDYQNDILSLEGKYNELLQDIIDNQVSLENRIEKAVEDQRQRAIDDAKAEKDAIQKSSQQFIQGLTDSLDKERKMYENSQSDNELNRLRRQLAILQRSGGSASQIRSLQQDIASREQDQYFNAQQDQIDAIQKASEEEMKRLDHQIEIMEDSLKYEKEHGLLWDEVYEVMNSTPEEIEQFLLENSKDLEGKSTLQIAEDLRTIKSEIEQWIGYRDDENNPINTEGSHNWNTYYTAAKEAYSLNETTDARIIEAAKAAYDEEYARSGDENAAGRAADEIFYKQFGDRPGAHAVAENTGYGTPSSSGGSGSSGGNGADNQNIGYIIVTHDFGAGFGYKRETITKEAGTTWSGYSLKVSNPPAGKMYSSCSPKTVTVTKGATVSITLYYTSNSSSNPQGNIKFGTDGKPIGNWQTGVPADAPIGGTTNDSAKRSCAARAVYGSTILQTASMGELTIGLTISASTVANKLSSSIQKNGIRYIKDLSSSSSSFKVSSGTGVQYFIIQYKQASSAGFSKGGLADYTGLAMVHGSKQNPEAFLNAEETHMWRDKILSGNNGSLTSRLIELQELVDNMVGSGTYSSINHDNGTVIENAVVNMNATISNDYDARRAADTVMDEMVRIARKTTAQQARR